MAKNRNISLLESGKLQKYNQLLAQFQSDIVAN